MTTTNLYHPNKVTITMPRLFLHLEGSAILVAAIAFYANLGFSWWAFALFLLAPDLSFIVYAVHRRAGSIVYNLVHTTVFPLALGIYSVASGFTPGIQASLIWFAHIGMDRLFGYGFKYPAEFKETHFNRI